MNPDIERLLDQLLQDRRMYNVVDWKAVLREHLEDAWYHGYTTGFSDSAVMAGVDGNVAADVAASIAKRGISDDPRSR